MPENNFFVVMSGERPSMYLVKGVSIDEVKKNCQHRMWNMTIFELKASPSQTTNPWSGIRLNEIAHNRPVVDIDNDVNSLNFSLDNFDVEQHENLIAKITRQLNDYLARRKGNILAVLEDEQTEVINMPPKAEPSNPETAPAEEQKTLDDMPNVPPAAVLNVPEQERVDSGGNAPVLPMQSSVEPEHSAVEAEHVNSGGAEGQNERSKVKEESNAPESPK